ncbi:MAG: hypothetical protein OXN15_01235 [Chloroflexota bacterium]|nr:hypothetical protein [Chloroflexota bacterium]MDE2899637.1 hypothetical protein [Chloroflexota bacterium]MDE2970198.1 hypothetical protein [Chloroflexota bacterium]
MLDRAESEGFDLLITADQSMRHQQNLAGKRLAVVVLLSNRWPRIEPKIDAVRTALDNTQPGQWTEVEI